MTGTGPRSALVRGGAHMLDVCVDHVGRDGVADREEPAGRFATASTLPIADVDGVRLAGFLIGAGLHRGARHPYLEDRAEIADLLEPERFGVRLSAEFQLHPEQSADAIVIHHPEAEYFNARRGVAP